MSSVVVQSDLDSFKASLPPHECILAEWFVRSLRKGRLVHSHHVGSMYLIVCTEQSLYLVKLHQKKIHSFKRYNLLDFTNIQVGYLSRSSEDALDECEVNPGLYAIRFYLSPKKYKTFKYPNNDVSDDLQKAFIQVIYSSLKASRRELYHSSPTPPMSIPSNNNNNEQPSPAHTPSPSPSPVKPDSFIITIEGYCVSTLDEYDPISGTLTITQRHFVWEPSTSSIRSPDRAAYESLTIPLGSIIECALVTDEDDDVSFSQRQLIKKHNYKLLQIFGDGRSHRFALPAKQAESACARLVQWVQTIQEKQVKELMTQAVIDKPPLLKSSDSTSNFRGESDILSVKDVLYLQYKMPDRHAMERWELVYSTAKHGISINTFYTKVAERAPSIIVVEDSNRNVFGCYATDPWVKSNQEYYGSGECFLFKIKPVSKVFKWSKVNDYFMFSSKDFISMGVGGDGYGLWLDSDFDQGNSTKCDTFNNEPLSATEQFRVLRMEAWSVPIFHKKKVPPPL